MDTKEQIVKRLGDSVKSDPINTIKLDPREQAGTLPTGSKFGAKPSTRVKYQKGNTPSINPNAAIKTKVKMPKDAKEAAQRRFKGGYAGPDKYKGIIPTSMKSKFKGKYFGKDSLKGVSK